MNEITNETQLGTLLAEDTAVIDFWAPWCGPCKALAPTFETLAKEVPTASFAKLNVDDNPELAARFGVRGIPTVVVFKKGKEANRLVGLQSLDIYKTAIE